MLVDTLSDKAKDKALDRTREGKWYPNRDELTLTLGSWLKFISRCKLKISEIYIDKEIYIVGQDGWAFNVAVRFQTIAHNLERLDPVFYWSGYYLLSLIVDYVRYDLKQLEAIEVIAIAYMYGGLSEEATTIQLQQMGVWPRPD